MPSQESYSPSDLGRRWHKKPESVIGLIRSGQLRGFNVAANLSGRPRFRVLHEDVLRFENERSATPTAPAPRTRRKRQGGNVIQFF